MEMDFGLDRQRIFFAENNGTLTAQNPPGGAPDYGNGWGNFYADGTGSKVDFFFWQAYSGTGDTWYDEFYLNYSVPLTLNYNSQTSVTVTNGDNVTFFMPFFEEFTNDTNAYVTISDRDTGTWTRSWWVCEDGPTDFIIKSHTWNMGYDETDFTIEIIIYNVTNLMFIHDWNTEFRPYLSPDFNYFDMMGHATWPDVIDICFRPYHALQVSNATWENTHPPPVYVMDGRVVDINDYQMMEEYNSDPWYIQLLKGYVYYQVWVYNMADKFIFFDILPDLDGETVWNYLCDAAVWLKNHAVGVLSMLGGYMVEIAEFLADAASWLAANMLRWLAVMMAFPIWTVAVLVVNSVKRFAVIYAADGPEAGGQYAAHLVGNAFTSAQSVAYRATSPIRVSRSGVGYRQRLRGRFQAMRYRLRRPRRYR